MSDLKQEIQEILQTDHVGMERAITVRDLCHLLWLTHPEIPLKCWDRKVRKAVRDLNMEEKPVVTRTRKPYGIFWADRIEDTKDYSSNLWSRIRKMVERARKVDETGTREFLKGQLSLFTDR